MKRIIARILIGLLYNRPQKFSKINISVVRL